MPSPKPAEAITEFNPTSPAPSPVKADFTSEGKVFDKAAVGASLTITSKSVRTRHSTGQFYLNSINIVSTAAGSAQVQAMLDESELSGGNAVWRDLGAPIAVAANALSAVTNQNIVQQLRVKFTAGAGAAVVDSWITSI